MGAEHHGQHGSQWSGIVSIAARIGCTAGTLRRWVRQHDRDNLAVRFTQRERSWLARSARARRHGPGGRCLKR